MTKGSPCSKGPAAQSDSRRPGRTLLPLARSILTALDTAQAELAELAGVITGYLRIGTIAGTPTTIEPALVRFHRQHPAVSLSIEETDSASALDRLVRGDIDLAAVDLFAREVPRQLTYHALSQEPLVAVTDAAPTADRPIPLADLADLGCCVELPAPHGLRQRVDDLFARAGIPQRTAFEVSSLDTVLRYVRLGMGYAIVPLSATTSTAAPHLAVRHLQNGSAHYPIGLVHRGTRPSAPAARAFLDTLIGANPQHPDDG